MSVRRRKIPAGLFPTEVVLCSALMERARAEGLQAHPETSGWDVLIVDPVTGVQVGVQAKLRPSVAVLAQALVGEREDGPEVHAVLVPVATWEFRRVASALRVLVLPGAEMAMASERWPYELCGALERAQRWEHPGRAWVPPVEVLGMVAGSPAPRTVSPWKVKAVRLCARVRAQGVVTAADFKALGLDRRWWTEPRRGCLVAAPGGGWEARHSLALPDKDWPELVAAMQSQATQ